MDKEEGKRGIKGPTRNEMLERSILRRRPSRVSVVCLE